MADEHLDFGDEEYGGSQRMQYHQAGAIPALAEEEMLGEEDEYDDLYNDVNVGESFQQMQRSEGEMPSHGGNKVEPRAEAISSQEVRAPGVANGGNYAPSGLQFHLQKPAHNGPEQAIDASQKGKLPDMPHNSQVGNSGFQGSISMPQNVVPPSINMSGKVAGESTPMINPNVGTSRGVPPMMPPNTTVNSSENVNMVNMNRSMHNEHMIQPAAGNGNTMLYVGELHWWTTDAELEAVLSQYGRVKELKFFDERASGKSKGYCQVEFYDPPAAAACKEGMNGYMFNGRACVVAFATPQTIKQMGAQAQGQAQSQSQYQPQGRRPMNDGVGRGNGTNYPSGRGGWGRGGQQGPNRGPAAGPMRGRGGAMGPKYMMGNAPGGGNTAGGGAYGQGLGGPAFGGPPGMMPPQGMMGPGFDPTFMNRGSGYGGFSGPGFPGVVPPFPGVNPMGLPGVAPHVNPAFFGRGMAPNGMGMMATAGMWTDPNMGGWGGEEYGRGTRESSYGGEDNASEYGDATHDKGVRSSAASRERERNSDRDWSTNPEKRHHDEREHDRDRYDRDHRQREEKDSYRDYRHKERDLDYAEDWDKRQSSSRSRSKSRAVPEEDHRSRSRDVDYGKRRRMPSE